MMTRDDKETLRQFLEFIESCVVADREDPVEYGVNWSIMKGVQQAVDVYELPNWREKELEAMNNDLKLRIAKAESALKGNL